MLAGGTGFAIFLLARRLFSDRVAFWAVVVAGIIPLFAVGSSLMTIDTLYVFFWSWAALAFWWAKDRSTLGPWVLTGALVGLGLLSKYTAAIELISFAAFCLWDQPSRIHLRRATFWTMLVTGTLMDYALPRASQMPWFELDRTETPSPVNPLGVKGVGEAGTIPVAALVAEAVEDALAPFGVRIHEMPLSPVRIRELIELSSR